MNQNCDHYEVYLTMGSVRGYHGDSFTKEEVMSAIEKFQESFEKNYTFCCGVRVIESHVVYQGYQEPCFDVHCVNYPRFPLESGNIATFMKRLARRLMKVFEQERITIFYPDHAEMLESANADESRVHGR